MTPPKVFQPLNIPIVALTLDHADGRDNMRPDRGTSEDKGGTGRGMRSGSQAAFVCQPGFHAK